MSTRQSRAPLAVRIALGIGALVLAVVAIAVGWNLRAAYLYNDATSTLTTTLQQVQQPDADVDALLAQQQRTDAQFNDAQDLDWVLLPELRDQIAHNSEVSATLTKRLADQQAPVTDKHTNDQSSNDDVTNKTQSSLTEEQRAQIQEMMQANESSPSTTESTEQHDDSSSQNNTDSSANTVKPW